MNAVVACLLWFYLKNLQGAAAASYTNGFPTRLVYSVSFPTGPSTRLIPEMYFACHGIIVGYTAALRDQSGDQDPVIQVWRKISSQPGSYYKTSAGIAIDDALCVGGLTVVSREVSYCNLNQTIAKVSVQPGDILGLELPKGDNDSISLAFARVSNSPTNYVFSTEELSSSITLGSSPGSSMVQELPQISMEIESNESNSKDCIRGFPNIPVSGRGRRTPKTSSITALNLLIPEMNFTCNVTIVGLTVTGNHLDRHPYSKIQIWQKNYSTYYQVGRDIYVNVANGGPVCVASRSMGPRTFTWWCILHDNFKASVQPGDILGLELPATAKDAEIYFTQGGPDNYVFNGQLGSAVSNLSYNESFKH